jgi:RND family efflux transporter MFP subunit
VRIGLSIALGLVLLSSGALWWLDSSSESTQTAAAPAQARIAVRTAPPQRGSFELRSQYHGELDADAAQIAARSGGLLDGVRVRIGDRVEAGQLLAHVDTAQLRRQIDEAEAQRRGAIASGARVAAELAVARSAVERSEPLRKDNLLSPQDFDVLRSRVAALEAELAVAEAQADQAQARKRLLQQQIDDARLVAPFDGAVAQRFLDPGAVVQPGTAVLELVRAGPLRVRFRVPERDLGKIHVGQSFTLTTQATGPRAFTGTLERIAAAITREDRSVAVEGVLAEEAAALRPGMHAQITLQLGVLDEALSVPGDAVVERDRAGSLASGVFVADDGRARFVVVRVVGRERDRVAVDDLPHDVQVVTQGQERLQDGALVEVVGGDT